MASRKFNGQIKNVVSPAKSLQIYCEYSIHHPALDESIYTKSKLRFIHLKWNTTKFVLRHPAFPTQIVYGLQTASELILTTAWEHWERKSESLWEWKTCMWGGQEMLRSAWRVLCWQSWVIRGKSPLKENIQKVINGFNKGAVYPFNRDKSSPSFSCADKTRHTDISFISPALDL